jgi:CHAT domain-containing protein/tetratricopeptide (TPR) repeat protein
MKFSHLFQKQFIRKWGLYILLAIASLNFCLALPVFAELPENSHLITQAVPTTVSPLETGLRFYESSRYGEAIQIWQQELVKMESSQQALCLSYLALAFQKMGNPTAAEDAIAQSLQRLQTLPPNPQLTAQILNSQGRIQISMGQPEAALASWQQAEQQYSAAADAIGQVGSQINQAQALQTLGLYRRAQSLLEQINTTLQNQPDSSVKALGLKSLGTVLQVTGNLDESRQLLRQSLDMQQTLATQPEAQTIDWRSQISDTQFSLANTLRSLQNSEAALSFYQQSAESATTELGQLQSQVNQLSLLIDRQQIPQAQSLTAQILPAFDRLVPSRDTLYLQVNFATQLSRLPQSSTHSSLTAAQLLKTAAQQAQTLADSRTESYAIGQLAHLYEQARQWENAQTLSQRALLLAQTAQADDIVYRWQWQLGRVLKNRNQSGDRATAKATYLEALNTLNTIRRDLLATHPDFQVSFRKDVEPLYRELVELLVQPTTGSSDDLQQARTTIEALRIAELENFFRSACLDTVEQVDTIDDRAAVLYPILLTDKLVVITSLPGQALRYHSIPVSQQTVETTIATFRRNLILPYSSNREIQAPAQQLYNWLVQPIAAELADRQIQTLVFVQDGALQTIPMSALYDGDRYLIETYSIALTPGLQLFAPKPLEEIPLTAVTAGLTEPRHRFEALEFVGVELAQIQSAIDSDVLLDRDFTSNTLANKINDSVAPILHIATHGQFSSQADQTFILAWDQPITVNQLSTLLQARDQQASRLELLVLSACETAIGDSRAALGLAGIAVQSGARSTLASLWLIDDESTPLLMNQFYQSLKTEPNKAAALRQAQLSLLQGEYRHPRFWSAFVLLGNWR